MSVDQMKDLYNTIVESDVKVQALLQTREGLKGIDMDVYKSNTGRAAKEFLRKSLQRMEITWPFGGNHHFYVNDPEVTAEHVKEFIEQ
ncbi:Oidioi.mRNA.OKI2018_I69.chr1.g2092.t1.cds [Oikopleura dioica]|uniref:Oidioi.mRNA.OKI2018_I69.chr1.g2092.t1.cds n=1 Tax=Oikopleura dioica TaxID=34765 RepID=A0ABN7SVB0_OIKDI|nr:Oidioi.mRNA.OKI2018_I69.chr1.g2092.t1.cds [Oikopleura dioica]